MSGKTDIVNRLAGKGYTKRAAKIIVTDVFDTISEMLADGNDIKLYGFGTFFTADLAERTVIDVRNKKEVTIPGHKFPKFSPGVQLRRIVREADAHKE